MKSGTLWAHCWGLPWQAGRFWERSSLRNWPNLPSSPLLFKIHRPPLSTSNLEFITSYDTIRYDTIRYMKLRALKSWRYGQLSLAHGTETKNKEKLKTKTGKLRRNGAGKSPRRQSGWKIALEVSLTLDRLLISLVYTVYLPLWVIAASCMKCNVTSLPWAASPWLSRGQHAASVHFGSTISMIEMPVVVRSTERSRALWSPTTPNSSTYNRPLIRSSSIRCVDLTRPPPTSSTPTSVISRSVQTADALDWLIDWLIDI